MLVGLTGKKGVGKSTVAELFKNEGFTELAFAHPLKDAAATLLGIPQEWLRNASSFEKEQVVPGFSITYRTFLQKMGTDFARDMISKDFWVERMHVELINHRGKLIVVSDIRFDNEAQLILDKGGFIIEIFRDLGEKDSHESEDGLSKHISVYTLYNNEGIETLPKKIEEILRKELIEE